MPFGINCILQDSTKGQPYKIDTQIKWCESLNNATLRLQVLHKAII